MRINYNVSAMLTNNALANNDSLLAKSLERLSSGLKINHAKDNPAGLAMAKRMDAQLAGLAMANQNASDGVSVIEIADGAMTEISEMLQRINELAIKAANGPLSDKDRATIQEEVEELQEEITRVSRLAKISRSSWRAEEPATCSRMQGTSRRSSRPSFISSFSAAWRRWPDTTTTFSGFSSEVRTRKGCWRPTTAMLEASSSS